MVNSDLLVQKEDGELVPFDEAKLFFSLLRAGADSDLAKQISEEVAAEVTAGERTYTIYQKAFKKLRLAERSLAARYSLKRAVLELGPTGFPFEDFIAEIMRRKGYQTQTRMTVKGACTTHEVDIIAVSKKKKVAIEAKFHSGSGLKSDVKVALYVKARFDDIARTTQVRRVRPYDEWWIVTNTKFSSQAEEYARCMGLTLISWSAPAVGNLQDLIQETNVHPITCLTTLSSTHKKSLLEKNIVLCQTLQSNPEHLERLGMSAKAIQNTLLETSRLRAVK